MVTFTCTFRDSQIMPVSSSFPAGVIATTETLELPMRDGAQGRLVERQQIEVTSAGVAPWSVTWELRISRQP
jgi:hypothetical protein